MITVDNMTKSFGEHILFDRITFKINSRERVGLVGRNGHGKTTLFRILIGDTHYDEGSLAAPKGYFTLHQLSKFLVESDLGLDIALNLDGGPSTGMLLASSPAQLFEEIPAYSVLPVVITVSAR